MLERPSNKRLKVLFSFLFLVGLVLGAGVTYAVVPRFSFTTVIEEGSMVSGCSYSFFLNGVTYCARNGLTGAISSTSANASSLINTYTASYDGIFLLQKGTYEMTGRIEIDSDDTIIGEGINSTILREANNRNLEGVIYSSEHSNIYIGNLQIDANGDSQTSNGELVSILITNLFENITVENTYLHDGKAGNLHIRTAGGSVQGKTVRVLNNIIGKSYSTSDSTDNLWVSNAHDVLIQGNTVSDSGHIGIIGASGGDYDVRIVNNHVYQTSVYTAIFGDGNYANWSHDIVISGNNIQGNWLGNGIELGNAVERVTVSNNIINRTLAGIRIINSKQITITANTVSYSQWYGIQFSNVSDCTASSNILVHNAINSTAAYSEIILDTNAKCITITGNTLSNPDATDYRFGILVDKSAGINNVTISSNAISNMLVGIRLLSSKGFSIIGNTISACQWNGIQLNATFTSIIGNIVTSNGQESAFSGIKLEVDGGGLTIVGNQVRGNTAYGVDLLSTGENILVANDLRGNTSGTYTGNIGTDIIASNNEA